jgi:sugar lactone lactonase YvrE
VLSLRSATAVLFLLSTVASFNALAWNRGDVDRFVALPAGSPNPEGIAADRNGNIYVSTFGGGKLFVFDRTGHLLSNVTVTPSSGTLLGLDFQPQTGDLLVLDFGAGNVLRVNPDDGSAQVFSQIPGGPDAGINALTFDQQGNVYVSASFAGAIYKIPPAGGTPVTWITNPTLMTTGVPPFGANGIGFAKAFDKLFVANTGNDTIVEIPVNPDGTAGTVAVFANSINGADGLIVDDDDNIWVCANQADEIVVVDKFGKAIAKLGDFNGIAQDGAPIGLLFPASLVRIGDWVYVTNLSLDLGTAFGLPTVDSLWAGKVKTQTVSRIRARIPHLQGE